MRQVGQLPRTKNHGGCSLFVCLINYEGGSESFRPDIQKPRQMENAVRDILYSDIYGEVNVRTSVWVEIKGDYIEKYHSLFISVTLKSWSGRKLLDPPS